MSALLIGLMMIGLMTFGLSGCFSTSAPFFASSGARLFKSEPELQSMKVQKLAAVSGGDCQITREDPPANISDARVDMQKRAAKMGANAVLLHQCQVMTAASSCFQLAVCAGTALNVSLER